MVLEGNPGETSRELRIWPQQDLLMVLNHGCSELIHRCANASQAGVTLMPSNIRFYDISGDKAANPELVSTYLPSRSAAQQPHEIFLWTDPEDPGRVLLFMSTPSSDESDLPGLMVTDISRAREGEFEEIGTWKGVIGNPDRDNRL
ncbi:MAG TPA: hypothetical protein VFY52_08015, partial [Thermoleophilaceae bacterium]|nr:hypothetical protein [Thermoleophilaceae bacterium]